jgi:hypothetical protein
MIGGVIKQVLWYNLSAKWNDASILHNDDIRFALDQSLLLLLNYDWSEENVQIPIL